MQKAGDIDLELLDMSLLQMLWVAYECWDLLYWDRVVSCVKKPDEDKVLEDHKQRVATS